MIIIPSLEMALTSLAATAFWQTGCAVDRLKNASKHDRGLISIVPYFYRQRDWRTLFGWRHALGLGVFLAVIAAWQIPFLLATGWEGTRSTWLEPGSSRLGFDLVALLKHLVEFPLSVFVATLPWSALLIALVDPRVRRKLGPDQRAALDFMLLSMAVIFVPVWIAEGGHHRYVMPMYPMMAVAAGIVVYRCLLDDFSTSLRRFWRDYLRVAGAIMLGLSAAFALASLYARIAQPPRWLEMVQLGLWPTLGLVALGLVGGAAVLRRARSDGAESLLQ
jgi:hypothetical protein